MWKYLLVPAVYGFAAGHVCGMLFRKAVVGAGVATLVGGTAAALWLPSLLAGGLRHWQVWLPPALALATARLLARPWGSDRLTARGPIAGLAAGVAACFLVLAAGVGFRVLEVPDRPDAEDDVRYVAGLPSFEENEAGRNLRTAAERLARRAGAGPVAADRPTAGARVPRAPSPERLAEVIRGGWPADGRELGEWLDWLYKPTHDVGAVAGLA